MRAAAILLLLLRAMAAATSMPLQDPLRQPGWDHFYNNEFEDALRDFSNEVHQHPFDPQAYNHVAQALLYLEMFRNGALESQLVTGNNPFLRRAKMEVPGDTKAKFNDALQTAVRLAEAELQKDPKSISALYALSVSHGLRSNYLFLVEKNWTEALRDATASRKYSNRILAIDQNFIDAYLVQGLHDYIVGSLPFYMRMLGFVAGFHGDRELGISEVKRVADHGVLNKYDARILLAVIYRREHRPQDALPLLIDASAKFPRNYLFRLEEVQMYSDLGNKQKALEILDEVDRLRAAGAPGYQGIPAGKIEYLRGNLLFWYTDLDKALENMKRATDSAQVLELNTAVLAWLRLGQIYDLKSEHSQAIPAYRQAMQLAPQSDAAAEAKGYISSPYRRRPRY